MLRVMCAFSPSAGGRLRVWCGEDAGEVCTRGTAGLRGRERVGVTGGVEAAGGGGVSGDSPPVWAVGTPAPVAGGAAGSTSISPSVLAGSKVAVAAGGRGDEVGTEARGAGAAAGVLPPLPAGGGTGVAAGGGAVDAGVAAAAGAGLAARCTFRPTCAGKPGTAPSARHSARPGGTYGCGEGGVTPTAAAGRCVGQ